MMDIGAYEGVHGLDKLLREIHAVLAHKKSAVVAVAGLPGAGKTYLVKKFVRLGFGDFNRKEILVIDDNTIYSTRFWRLKWEKLKIEKKQADEILASKDEKVIFFSNWIPSRFLAAADLYVILRLSENERVKRLKKRERKAPEKFLIQKNKDRIPLEEPFDCPRVMTIVNPSGGASLWFCMGLIKRIFVAGIKRLGYTALGREN